MSNDESDETQQSVVETDQTSSKSRLGKFDPATVIASLALLVSLAGVVYQQIQSRQMDVQGDLAIHSMLIDRNASLLEMIVKYPDLRPYFYDNSTIQEDDEHYNRVQTMAELWADLFEQVIIQLEHLPKNMAPTWREYAKSMYLTSPAIRSYFTESHSWYVIDLRELWLPLGEELAKQESTKTEQGGAGQPAARSESK